MIYTPETIYNPAIANIAVGCRSINCFGCINHAIYTLEAYIPAVAIAVGFRSINIQIYKYSIYTEYTFLLRH